MITEEMTTKNEIITFGCRLNIFESQAIKNAVDQSGQDNLIVFNSCAVTSEAERELRQKIRNLRKKNPQAKIIVTGCAAQINPEKYAKMPEVDLVLGNTEKSNPQSYLKQNTKEIFNQKENRFSLDKNLSIEHKDKLFFSTKDNSLDGFLSEKEMAKIKVNNIMSVKQTAPQMVAYFKNKTRAFLEIQNGCNHRCTFCIIPFARGNSRSVAFGEIVDQVKKMVAFGHQEVVFTGVDISDYGKDLPSSISLSQMIKRLMKLVPELPRLRLSSIDVAEIDDGFFDLLENEPRFMPYFHLSVQSGDDMILKRMARRHDRKQILNFCNQARKIRSDVTFGADIIAGFPTEDEKMFSNSLELIKEADIIFTHIFPYSKREGTPAAKMPQLDGKIIKERAKILRKAGEEQLQKFLDLQIGKRMKILLESNQFGKSENFLDIKISETEKEEDMNNKKADNDEIKNKNVGKIIETKITKTQEGFLIGEIYNK
jgi:threonylcarbamoyladenosine tRNA methylthiotransferase MtaB